MAEQLGLTKITPQERAESCLLIAFDPETAVADGVRLIGEALACYGYLPQATRADAIKPLADRILRTSENRAFIDETNSLIGVEHV